VSWVRTNILGLSTQDRTLLILAKMTSNTYTTPNTSDLDALDGWNKVCSSIFVHFYILLSTNDSSHCLVGNLTQMDSENAFVSDDNFRDMLSIKGTSAGWITGAGSLRCYQGNYRCDQTCLEKSLTEESLFSIGVVGAS
jgi:putative lipase involved disintegration of autophagic bodies